MTNEAPDAADGPAQIEALRHQLVVADLEAQIFEARARAVVAQARMAEARLSMMRDRKSIAEGRIPSRIVMPDE